VRRLVIPGTVFLVTTIGLVVALFQRPGDSALALEVYALFLGTAALAALVRLAGRSAPLLGSSQLELALRERPVPEDRIPELERVERTITMARQTVFDVHYRLRPMLRDIARHRLALRGVDLDAPGGSAEKLLGPDAWALLRPDLPRPDHHFARGIELGDLARTVDALERI
jgi:hypothetical protein